MKILMIGATGAIGKIIKPAFEGSHEIITVGRNSGDILADISSAADLAGVFKKSGRVDAIICAAGDSQTSELQAMDIARYEIGIRQKLHAQINLVLIGLHYLNDKGSVTLISGKTGERPVKGSSGKAVANGAVNSFVLAAALEMPRGIRLNAISPARLSGVKDEELIYAYTKSLTAGLSGEIIRVGYRLHN